MTDCDITGGDGHFYLNCIRKIRIVQNSGTEGFFDILLRSAKQNPRSG